MYLLYAPPKKFGALPAKTSLLTDEVKFTNNVAYCPKYYWKKHHCLQGCLDISPRWLKKMRSKRQLFSILFVAQGGIGDILWYMPFMKAVRLKYPRARIVVATREDRIPLFLGVPFADLAVKDDYWNLQHLISQAHEVYDFGGIATMLRKEMKLDPVDATFLDGELPKPTIRKDCRPMLVVTAQEGKQAKNLLEQHGVDLSKDKVVAIALEASTANRNWPYSYNLQLSRRLTNAGYKVIWLSAKHEINRTYFNTCPCGWEFNLTTETLPAGLSFKCPICKEVSTINELRPPQGIANLAGKTNIRQAISIIALSDLFIGPNSGLMVIATALETPTIGLFGAFNPKVRTKYYDRFAYIWGHMDCSPCKEHWTECPKGHPAPCMKIITVDMVYNKAVEMIARFPRESIERLPID